MAKRNQNKTKTRPLKRNEAVSGVSLSSQSQSKITEVVYEVDLKPGEAFSLPADVAQILGPGHWRVSITAGGNSHQTMAAGAYTAFLRSYAPEDEGLYDDYPTG
jgi:hypothetical protein